MAQPGPNFGRTGLAHRTGPILPPLDSLYMHFDDQLAESSNIPYGKDSINYLGCVFFFSLLNIIFFEFNIE